MNNKSAHGHQTLHEQYAKFSMHRISKLFVESIILHNECHTLNKPKLQHAEQSKRVDILRVMVDRLHHDRMFQSSELAPTLSMLKEILESVIVAIAYNRSMNRSYDEVNKWGTTVAIALVRRDEDQQAADSLYDAINLSTTGYVRPDSKALSS